MNSCPGQHHRVTGPGRGQTGQATSYCPMYTQHAHLREGPNAHIQEDAYFSHLNRHVHEVSQIAPKSREWPSAYFPHSDSRELAKLPTFLT